MKRALNLSILALTVLATLGPHLPKATPAPGYDYGYGSGALGTWSTGSTAISEPWQFDSAPVWEYGDSIMRADGYDFAVRLYTAKSATLAVNNWNGRPTGPAVDQLLLDLAAHAAPKVIVMATGTNDIFAPPMMAAEIDRVMAAVPSTTQVVWVNVWAQRSGQSTTVQMADMRNAAWVNMQVAQADGKYTNLTAVGWYEFLAEYPTSRPGSYLADGVHTSTTGKGARNALIVATVKNYLP